MVSAMLVVSTVGTAHAGALEEIIVTAQKREQSIQDVPISITAVAGEELRASNIEKLEALAPTVPTLHVTEAFGGDQIFLRGLGPGVNGGFEQAVGMVVDGFFYGRSRFSRLQFLDLTRVEVLKGPQGAILGKNTTAGAINITTAKPTSEFEGWVDLSYEFEGAEGYVGEGAVSGPITDALSARLAVRYEDKDGFLENGAMDGRMDQSRDDLATRLSVLFEPTDAFNALLSWGYTDVDREGRNIQTILCSPAYRAAVPEEDCKLDDKRYVADRRNGQSGYEYQKTEADTWGLTLTWEFDGLTLTSLTGYGSYDYRDAGVASYSDIESFMIDLMEDYDQLSQEVRVTSNNDGNLSYIAGLYYLGHELDSIFDLNIRNLGPAVFDRNRHIETEQDGDLWAAFAQLSYRFGENWAVTLEGRYTEEEKDGRSRQYPTALYSDVPVPGPGTGGPAGLFNVHDVSDDISESDFSPGIVLTYTPADELLYYVSLRKGFKGGGFDHYLTANQAQASDGRFPFDDEQVQALELGAKTTFADGTARLNVSVYRNDYDDLQVSALTGPGTFTVGNVASATTQGVDVDFQWQATDSLSLQIAASYLDAEYNDFELAPCSAYQTANGLCPEGVQDLSGKDLPYAPEFSYSAALNYTWPLGDELAVEASLRAYGEDDKYLAQDLDPVDVQKDYIKYDARIALVSSSNNWQIALIGRNLTDEITMGFANDITFFAGSHYGMTESPRSYTVQALLRF